MDFWPIKEPQPSLSMAEMRDPSVEMSTASQISDRERAKCASVTSPAEALEETQNLRTSWQGAAGVMPVIQDGCSTRLESHDAVGQYSWFYATRLQHPWTSEEPLGNCFSLGANAPNQDPATFQTHCPPPTGYFNSEPLLSCNPPVSNLGPFIELTNPSNISSNFPMTDQNLAPSEWVFIAPSYQENVFQPEDDLEYVPYSVTHQEFQSALTDSLLDTLDFSNISNSDLTSQELITDILHPTLESIGGTTSTNEYPNSPAIDNLQNGQHAAMIPVRQKPHLASLERQLSKSTEASSSTSSSSFVIVTPPSENDFVDGSYSPPGDQKIFRVRSASSEPTLCQFEWTVPKRGRRKKNSSLTSNRMKSKTSGCGTKGSKTRSPFPDEESRKATALTRKLKSCLRCSRQKIRCIINTHDPKGPCETCLRASSTMSRPLCFRYKITNSISLYREQKEPNPIWTRRWKDFTPQNITLWASTTIRKIKVTHGMGNSSYELEVQKFVPMDGDLMYKFWTVNGDERKCFVPPYAIVDLEKAAQSRFRFIRDNFKTYIECSVSNSDELIQLTYERALRHSAEAKGEEEKTLLRHALYMWVAARMSSTTEWLCGDDLLDMEPVTDAASPYYKHTPIPPVMSAQFQIIAISKILRPLKEGLVNLLTRMSSAADTRKNWFALYLTYFILLHSCALVTRRDREYARQINLSTPFANPQSISDHHFSALILLLQFHYSNKKSMPFTLVESSAKLHELKKFAELNEDQVQFLKDTAKLVQQKREMMLKVREDRNFGNDYYFISQLYDADWCPTPIAEAL